MLSVTKRIPDAIIHAIGAAKGVGRDRWLELTLLIENPSNLVKAGEFVETEEFTSRQPMTASISSSSFKDRQKDQERPGGPPMPKVLGYPDKSVSVITKDTGKAFTLHLKAKDASRFGGYSPRTWNSSIEPSGNWKRSKQETETAKEKGPRTSPSWKPFSCRSRSENRISANQCQEFWRRFGERISFAY